MDSPIPKSDVLTGMFAFLADIVDAADKGLGALNRMHSGIKANDRVARKRKMKEMSNLYHLKKPKKQEKPAVRRHRFVCLA